MEASYSIANHKKGWRLNDRQKCKRRWRFQIGIRSILILIALLAIGVNWIDLANQQRRHIETIEMHGGKVGYDFEVDQSGQFLPDEVEDPNWLLRVLGSEYGRKVARVDLRTIYNDDYAWKRPPQATTTTTDPNWKSLLQLKDVKHLDLRFTLIENINELSELRSLRSLNLRQTRVNDISALENHKDLERLDISQCAITDFSPIKHLTKLRELRMGSAAVKELSFLINCVELQLLDVSSRTLEDISGVAGLRNLNDLDLKFSLVSDISALGSNDQLTRLNISQTNVSNLTPLTNHTGLQRIDASGTLVNDLTPLSGMPGLRRLYLTLTNIADLSPLAHLKNLEELGVSNIPVRDARIVADLPPTLKRLYLDVEQSDIYNAVRTRIPNCRVEMGPRYPKYERAK